MHEFDQYLKQTLRVKCYIRYADDFVVFSQDRKYLVKALESMRVFLRDTLKLELHPHKVSIETLGSGVDFLGWVHFPTHRALRTSTKRRMLKKTRGLENESATVRSYVGMLGWGNTQKLRNKITNQNT